MNTTNTKSHPNNPYCPHYISHLIKEYTYGKEYPSLVTRPADNYIRSVKSYGWEDTEFVNGYQTIKWTRLIVKHNNSIIAHVIFKGSEPKANWNICTGNCLECAKANVNCWALKNGEHVAFHEH